MQEWFNLARDDVFRLLRISPLAFWFDFVACEAHSALMMVAVSTYETSVYFYDNTHISVPESCHIQPSYCKFPIVSNEAICKKKKIWQLEQKYTTDIFTWRNP
jgi:hypothetical protein